MRHTLMLVLMSFIIVSCGGGKSTATLTVDRGFVVGNSSFSGGIYISGEKTDGSETFLATVLSGNSTNVSISKGTWNIKVVGWDGGIVMEGTPYCGTQTNFNFSTEGQKLQLSTSTAGCSASTMSGTDQQNGTPWKGLVVNSCGAMYKSSNSTLLNTSATNNPCGSYPVEYGKTYPNYRLVLYNQNASGVRSPVVSSSCTAAQNNLSTVKFPNRMPVTIKFYKDDDCLQEADEYIFKKGLDSSLANRANDDFDWLTTSDSSSFYVTVANGASRRGTTAFHTETPTFKCLRGSSYVPCVNLPTVTDTYYLDLNTYAVIKIPQSTCGVAATGAGGVSITQYSCDVKDGFIYIGLKATNTTPKSGSIKVNGISYPVVVGNTNTSFDNDRVRDTYKTLKRALGYQGPSELNNSLADDFDEEDNDQIGFLGSPLYDLSSMGAGGIFYNQYTQCTSGALEQIFGSYQKDGFTYQVTLSGIVGQAPGYMSRAGEPDQLTAEDRYNRRIVVRKILGGALTTEKIIDFACDANDTSPVDYGVTSSDVRAGRMEEQKEYSLGAKTVSLKRIMYWNTSSLDTSRFDVYRYKRVATSGTLEKMETNFYRVTKASDSDFKIKAMTYESVKNGTGFEESLLESEVDSKKISSLVTYAHKKLFEMKIINAAAWDIFLKNIYSSELNQVRMGYRTGLPVTQQNKISTVGDQFVEATPSASELKIRYPDSVNGLIMEEIIGTAPELVATAISPDGSKKVVVISSGTKVYVYPVSGSSMGTAQYADVGGTLLDLKISLSDDGKYLLGYILDEMNDSLHWIYGSFSGIGTIKSGPYTSYNHNSLVLTTDGTYHYILSDRGNGTTQFVDICRVQSSGDCGFNKVAQRTSPDSYKNISLIPTGGDSFNIMYSVDEIMTRASVILALNDVLTVVGETDISNASYSSYTPLDYTIADESAPLRSSALTEFHVDYPYYSPSIGTFQMKLMNLKEDNMSALFTSGFSALSN